MYTGREQWITSPGITQVNRPSESPPSGVYETAFETSIAGCGRAGGAIFSRSGEAQWCGPVTWVIRQLAAKVQWAADSTKRPGIARVSYPLESPLSEVHETTFRIPIAGRGRAGGRFLVAVVKFHHVTL